MKWAGVLLVIVSLSAGSLAAASAYHVPLSLPDSYFEDGDGNYLTLKTDAGVVVLTKETLAKVKKAGSLQLDDVADPLNKQALKRLKPEQLSKAIVEEKTGMVLLDGIPVALAVSETGKKNAELTPALLARLREQSKSLGPRISRRYVVVREFYWAEPPYSWLNLWPYNWLFLLSVLGLLGGAVLLRMSAKKEIAAAGESGFQEGPQAALDGIRDILEDLRREVGSMKGREDWLALQPRLEDQDQKYLLAIQEAKSLFAARIPAEHVTELKRTPASSLDNPELQAIREKLSEDEIAKLNDFLQARSELKGRLGDEDFLAIDDMILTSMEKQVRMRTIIQKLDQAQRTHMPAFIDARPQLIARFGMGGYAKLMDSYAACERQINRAWSAAADEVYEESIECLDNAAELIDETIEKMK